MKQIFLPLRFLLPAITIAISLAWLILHWRNVVSTAEQNVEEEYTYILKSTLSRMQGTLERHIRGGDWEGVGSEITQLRTMPDIEAAGLADGEEMRSVSPFAFSVADLDRELRQYDGPFTDHAQVQGELHRTLAGSVLIGRERTMMIGLYPVIIQAEGHDLRPSRVGLLFATVDLSHAKERARYFAEKTVREEAFAATGLALLFGLLLHLAVSRRVGRLVTAARKIASGTLSARTGVFGRDELGMLGGAFDEMAVKIETGRRDLERSEERYRSLIDQASEAIFYTSEDGKHFLEANQRALELVGCDAETIKGLSPCNLGLRPPGELQVDGKPLVYETEIKTPKGPVAAEVSLTRITNGWLQFMVRDISERKRAEELRERLRELSAAAELAWRNTFDAIETPLFITDPRGALLRWNKSATSLMRGKGLTVEEQADSGEPWGSILYAVQVLAGGDAQCGLQVSDVLGETWEVMAARYESGEGVRCVIIVKNVSDTVRMQETLRRYETMAATGRMVATVAHQLRNPLFGITAVLDTLESDSKVSAAIPEPLAVLRSSTTRLVRLADELLAFARPPEKGLAQVSMAGVVSQAVENCAALAAQRNVDVRVHAQYDLPAIRGDDHALVQAVQNLLENAIYFSKPGTAVNLSLTTVQRERTFVSCVITDSGPGIPAEDLPFVFEPFFTKRHSGTGLGLSIVRQTAEAHGGSVHGANNPQGGASFQLLLPVAPTENAI